MNSGYSLPASVNYICINAFSAWPRVKVDGKFKAGLVPSPSWQDPYYVFFRFQKYLPAFYFPLITINSQPPLTLSYNL